MQIYESLVSTNGLKSSISDGGNGFLTYCIDESTSTPENCKSLLENCVNPHNNNDNKQYDIYKFNLFMLWIILLGSVAQLSLGTELIKLMKVIRRLRNAKRVTIDKLRYENHKEIKILKRVSEFLKKQNIMLGKAQQQLSKERHMFLVVRDDYLKNIKREDRKPSRSKEEESKSSVAEIASFWSKLSKSGEESTGSPKMKPKEPISSTMDAIVNTMSSVST